ncbi:hypothetical protein HPB49_003489 [Dermacentor silvarum]|uniref:Uncharacterized protein n=1 Tax=Dermacentor silvarum TaxID=543639 RepID=A0ACB8DTZ0_DERSI|nr:hypothetical protein HPB49_003489 [Dermacentor silvarum]
MPGTIEGSDGAVNETNGLQVSSRIMSQQQACSAPKSNRSSSYFDNPAEVSTNQPRSQSRDVLTGFIADVFNPDNPGTAKGRRLCPTRNFQQVERLLWLTALVLRRCRDPAVTDKLATRHDSWSFRIPRWTTSSSEGSDVVKTAQAIDAAAKDAGEIARATGSPSTEATVNKMTTKGGTCSRCGGDHSPSQCQFSQAQCFTWEKLNTSHGFAEGGGRTADSSSSLDQAMVPHQPAVRVAVASVRDGDVRQQVRVL